MGETILSLTEFFEYIFDKKRAFDGNLYNYKILVKTI